MRDENKQPEISWLDAAIAYDEARPKLNQQAFKEAHERFAKDRRALIERSWERGCHGILAESMELELLSDLIRNYLTAEQSMRDVTRCGRKNRMSEPASEKCLFCSTIIDGDLLTVIDVAQEGKMTALDARKKALGVWQDNIRIACAQLDAQIEALIHVFLMQSLTPNSPASAPRKRS